jgi:hypothetical protein
MNFHLFVFMATIIFYIIFKMHKTQVQNNKSQNKSFLIYVLFIPALLYFTQYYIFKPMNVNTMNINTMNPNNMDINNTNGDINLENIDFDSLLTSPYPESSIVS